MVAGHSYVTSFLICCSSAKFFAALHMNEVKSRNLSRLFVGGLIMNGSSFSYKIRHLIGLCGHALTQFLPMD